MDPTDSPERGFKTTVMLADFAQASGDGKLTVVGGGWTVTGPEPAPFAIAGIIEVPWHLTNQKHKFRFELIDLDGQSVTIETPEGQQPLFFEGEFEVGRPPGVRPGTAMTVPLALLHGPVPLAPGSHFEWRWTIDGEAHEDWRLGFSTRPVVQSLAA